MTELRENPCTHTPRRLLTGVVTAVMLTTAAPAMAQAAPAPAAEQAASITAPALNHPIISDTALTQDVIDRFDRYVSYDPAFGFVLTLPKNTNLPRAQVALVRSTIAESNAQLATADPALTIASHNLTVREGQSTTAVRRHGGGSMHWWGVTLWLDEHATSHLLKLIDAGAALSVVAAFVTSETGVGTLISGIIAAMFALGSAEIRLCDWHDKGVNFHFAKPYKVGPKWCWPR